MTKQYGVTPTGFSRPGLLDVKADLEQGFREEFGPVNTAGDSVIGQFIGVVSKPLADVWEGAEATYDAMYPGSANGVSLDRAVSLVSIRRTRETATTITGVLTGVEGVTIPAGKQASLAETGEAFVLDQDVTILRSALLQVTLTVETATPDSMVQIALNGAVYGVSTGPTVTAESLAGDLAALLDDLAAVTASADGAAIVIRSADGQTAFAFAPVSGGLVLSDLGAPGQFTALEKGAISAPAGSLTKIDTPVTGWESISNLLDGATGEDVETDTSLRQRQGRSARITGSSTVLAMRARLEQEVPSVTYARIYENRGLTPDTGGRPAKSFECIVEGGDDQAIAEMIWQVKPGGMETWGNTERVVVDSNGDPQIMRFSRPEEVECLVQVSVDRIYDEEKLPADPVAAIVAAISGKTLPIGKDIIAQRIEGRVHAAVKGLEEITVTLARGSGTTPLEAFSAATHKINERQIARLVITPDLVGLPTEDEG